MTPDLLSQILNGLPNFVFAAICVAVLHDQNKRLVALIEERDKRERLERSRIIYDTICKENPPSPIAPE